jgi:hypothetical protein
LQLSPKLQPYAKYLALTEKQKQQMRKDAKQDAVGHGNPQGGAHFAELDFISFKVNNGRIKLMTYRHVPSNQ